jgi:CBS domain-containing protein
MPSKKLSEILQGLTVKTPVVSPSASLLDAITALRKNDYRIVLVGGKISEERQAGGALVISGYSIVSKLLESGARKYGVLLGSKCVDSALVVGSIDDGKDMLSLLHVFETTTFGFAALHQSGRNDVSGTISVKDLLPLYQSGVLSTKLEVNDVKSSPIIAMPKDSKLSEALQEMLRFKLRKLLISGSDSVVTDTQILSYLFQDSVKLEESFSKRLQEGTLQKIESSKVPNISKNDNVKAAAEKLRATGSVSLLTEDGIVSPWDLIMKPWRLGELVVS